MTTRAGERLLDRRDDGLARDERRTYREAAEHARRTYPGALGELVHRELRAYADFGYRLAGDGLVVRLAAEVLAEVQEAASGRAER